MAAGSMKVDNISWKRLECLLGNESEQVLNRAGLTKRNEEMGHKPRKHLLKSWEEDLEKK